MVNQRINRHILVLDIDVPNMSHYVVLGLYVEQTCILIQDNYIVCFFVGTWV